MQTTTLSTLPNQDTFKQLIINQTTIGIPLDSYTLITCEGEDACTFLQGQLTCNLLMLDNQNNNISLGSCCTPNGRMVSLFYVIKHSSNSIWLFVAKRSAATLLQHLGKYSIFSQVTLQDNPKNMSILGIICPLQTPLSITETTITKETETRRIIQLPTQSKTHLLYITTTPNTTVQYNASANESYWHLALLLEGIPYFHEDLANQYMPSDLHLDTLGGISYNKGCYTGQEPIARLHFKGKPKFTCRLIEWHTDIPLQAGTSVIQDSKKIGTLIQSIMLANQQWLGLARIRIDTLQNLEEQNLETAPFTLGETDLKVNLSKVTYNNS